MFIGIRCLRLRRSGCQAYYYNYYSSTQGPESDDGPHCDDNDEYGASEHLLYPYLSTLSTGLGCACAQGLSLFSHIPRLSLVSIVLDLTLTFLLFWQTSRVVSIVRDGSGGRIGKSVVVCAPAILHARGSRSKPYS
jgi:hypothetical protein